jgi:hypothetical protein
VRAGAILPLKGNYIGARSADAIQLLLVLSGPVATLTVALTVLVRISITDTILRASYWYHLDRAHE